MGIKCMRCKEYGLHAHHQYCSSTDGDCKYLDRGNRNIFARISKMGMKVWSPVGPALKQTIKNIQAIQSL